MDASGNHPKRSCSWLALGLASLSPACFLLMRLSTTDPFFMGMFLLISISTILLSSIFAGIALYGTFVRARIPALIALVINAVMLHIIIFGDPFN